MLLLFDGTGEEEELFSPHGYTALDTRAKWRAGIERHEGVPPRSKLEVEIVVLTGGRELVTSHLQWYKQFCRDRDELGRGAIQQGCRVSNNLGF
jgi:hypothetical protein